MRSSKLHPFCVWLLIFRFLFLLIRLPALNRSSSESPHNFNTANKSKALLRSQTEIIPLTTAKLARVKTSNKFKTGAIVATTCLKSTTNKVNESIDCDTDKTGAATDLNRSPICGRITLRKIRSKFRKKTKKVNNSISTEEPPIQAILENNIEIWWELAILAIDFKEIG